MCGSRRLQESSPGEVESLGEGNFPLKLVFPLEDLRQLKLESPREDQFKFTAESRPRLVMLLRTASSWPGTVCEGVHEYQ